ncbi:MAG: Rod shape-determining protein RodA [Ignavibacteria bacterium]|nr:Rod shape-determining protein RodA [Ignavibacteria bacterium]
MAKDYTFILQKPPGANFDWTTFFITILLCTLGLLSVYSATFVYSTTMEAGNMSHTFSKQLYACLLGLSVMVLIMFIPEKVIRFLAYFLYGLSIALLVLVLVKGEVTAGTKGWINFGSFTIQPSEIAKIGTTMAIARFLSQKGIDIRTIRDFAFVILLIIIPMALILVEPDFGSATVFLGLLLGIMVWCGFDLFVIFFIVSLPIILLTALIGNLYFFIALAILSLLCVLFRKRTAITVAAIVIFIGIGYSTPLVIERLQPHQRNRIETFVNPEGDPRGKAYNVIQSKLAVGSGGLYGKGFLHGTQTQLRYIPKQWTDFIFSVPAEEFGFIGAFLVIALIISLIMRAIRIAYDSDSPFFSVCAIGFASILLYHSVINIGMVIGLVPVMGIPLPFLSSGGTFILTNLAMVGILLNSYRQKKRKR